MSIIPEQKKLPKCMSYLTEYNIDSKAKFFISIWEEIINSSETVTRFHLKFNYYFMHTIRIVYHTVLEI